MRSLYCDLRYAARTLLRSPGFTALAVLALALGIGANTAIYSLVNAVLLRPLPYDDPGRLVEIGEKDKNFDYLPVDYLDYLEWRSQSDAFERTAFQATFGETLTGAGLAENVQVAYVTADFFRTLGVQPMLGRDLAASDDERSAAPVAILSHAFWQERFGGDATVLGRTVRLGDSPTTIIGVLPDSFRYHRAGQLYVAFGPFLTKWGMDTRGNHNNAFVLARVKRGVSLESAQAQLDTVTRRLEAQYPGLNKGIGAVVHPLKQLITGGARWQMFTLLGAVGFVLLIACVNAMNLTMARSAARREEIVVRAALGAGRLQIARQLLLECVLLSVAAAVVGLLFAEATFGVLARLLPWGFERGDVNIDGAVLGFTFGVACATAILFGLAPAMQAANLSLSDALKENGRSGSSGAARVRLRRALIVAQVSISMVLLTGAGLLVRSYWRLMQVSPGFETEHLLTMDVKWPYWESTGSVGAVNFYKRLTGRVRALPGVREAGAIWPLPLDYGGAAIPFYRDDKPIPEEGQLPVAPYHRATPDYFGAAGIPLLKGRIFSAADGQPPQGKTQAELLDAWRASTIAAVISDSMARKFWPDEDPVGHRIRFGPPGFNGPWLKIVGVVGDVRGAGLEQPPEAEMYLSAYQDPNDETLVVRSAGDPAALTNAIRRAVAELDPNIAVANVRTMDQVIGGRVSWRQTNMLLIGSFAVLALVLAAVGLYGVMAYMVARQRHEFGIRMALGARGADVLLGVMREAGALALAGVVIGALGGLALTRVLASLLFGLEATDPATFATAGVMLLAVAGLASWIPARRAAGVDPIIALRYQ